MTAIGELITGAASQPALRQIGWALVHFVWQGLAVAMLAGVTLRLLRGRSPNARYVLACGALAVLAALPVATALLVSAPAVQQEAATALSPSVYMPAALEVDVPAAPVEATWTPAAPDRLQKGALKSKHSGPVRGGEHENRRARCC